MVSSSQYDITRLAGAGLSLGIGALYCASTLGAVSAVTFLATAILSNKVLDRVAFMPMANFTYKVIKGEIQHMILQAEKLLIDNKQKYDAYMNKFVPYVCFAQLFLLNLSCLIAYYANQSLTSFADAAITFTVKQLPSSVMLVTSITLLYISVILIRDSIKNFHEINELTKKMGGS